MPEMRHIERKKKANFGVEKKIEFWKFGNVK